MEKSATTKKLPKRPTQKKILTDDDNPILDKHGNIVYSKKYKLLLSLDKTNTKKKKVTTVNSDSKAKLKYIENLLSKGPLYSYN